MEEVWKPVPGFEGYYEVSNTNQVKSLDRVINTKKGPRKLKGKILNQYQNEGGYYFVGLSVNGKIKYRLVHILVAAAFPEICGVCPEGYEVNHKDENKANNTPENLEYMPHKSNINYGTGRERHARAVSKLVLQYDFNGKFVKEWQKIREAALFLKIDEGGISACCRGKQKSAGGFRWRFA